MKVIKKTLNVVFVANALVLAVNLAANYRYYAAGNDWRYSVFFSLSITTLGVLSGALLLAPLFSKYNWTKYPTLKLLLSVLIFAVYGLALMYAAIKLSAVLFRLDYGNKTDIFITNATFSILFSIIIGLIISGRNFLAELKNSIEDNEHMKQEMIRSRYETLKSQVNPHFLFNSLNTLTVMIPQQPDVAVQFVEQMSKVFRYSLQYSNEQTVEIETELKVVRSYLFLNEQRFNDKLNVSIRIDDNVLRRKIVTQSLLMLAENAIKHNEISMERPLSLDIYSEHDYLVVANTLQPKAIMEQSTKVGLENIKKRYGLASDMPVVIEERECFKVKIPLLK